MIRGRVAFGRWTNTSSFSRNLISFGAAKEVWRRSDEVKRGRKVYQIKSLIAMPTQANATYGDNRSPVQSCVENRETLCQTAHLRTYPSRLPKYAQEATGIRGTGQYERWVKTLVAGNNENRGISLTLPCSYQ